MKRLKDDSGVPTAFIRTPRQLKFIWDTLSCCIVLESSKHNRQHAYIDLVAEVLECGADNAPLHIKIALSHHERARDGHKLQIELSELKTVLMPRLRLPTHPEGRFKYNAPQMQELISMPKSISVLYSRIRYLRTSWMSRAQSRSITISNYSAPSWGPVPMSCTCRTCFGHFVCAFRSQGVSAVGVFRCNRV